MYPTMKNPTPTNGQLYFDKEKETFFVFKKGEWVEKAVKSSERITQVFRNDAWHTIDFSCLGKNERFRMFNPDGTIVKDEKGKSEWVSKTKAYYSPNEKAWKIKYSK